MCSFGEPNYQHAVAVPELIPTGRHAALSWHICIVVSNLYIAACEGEVVLYIAACEGKVVLPLVGFYSIAMLVRALDSWGEVILWPRTNSSLQCCSDSGIVAKQP